jgi:hypothetical protein
MASKDDHIKRLYDAHRIYPRSQPHDGRHPSPHRAANRAEPHEEIQRNQFRENEHGPGYDNDVSKRSWLQNGDATTKPSFDKHENAWRSPSKGNTFGEETIKVRSADFRGHHTEFERHNANGSVTHEQQAHDFSKRHVTEAEKRLEMGIYDSDHPKHRGPWLKGKQ